MFLQVIAALSQAVQAAYNWFWDFIHDGYGNIALTIVFGMVIFSILFRFILMPLFGHSFNAYGLRFGSMSMASDMVKGKDRPHPNFSEKG